MNWDAIGAVGEIIGAGAVVVSLLYLALQVKTQNRESRLAATHDIFEAWRTTAATYQVSENAELLIKALDNFDDMSDTERFRVIAIVTPTLRIWEEAYYQRLDGRLDDQIWESMSRFFADAMSTQSWQKVWALRGHVYSDKFREYVDTVELGSYRTK